MKVVLVNKFNFLKGGADKYFLELSDLLKSQGHEVIKFCMDNQKNIPDKNEKFFVSYVDKLQKGFINKLRYIGRMLYSFEAKKKFKALLMETKPDIIHIHNIYHQISPSILTVAKKMGIPVIMHLHDYKLISPNYLLFNDQGIDTSSLPGKYYKCFLKKSFNNSYSQSFLVMIEMYFHHRILKIYEKNILYYCAPSLFIKNLMISSGIPASKIMYLPYFVKGIEVDEPDYHIGKYFVFYGRLEKEKGVNILLEAISLVPEARVKIIGDGKEKKSMEKLSIKLGLQNRVEFSQALYNEDLKNEIRRSMAVITPSVWYEVFGLVNVEAAALGKLVIASDIGGIKESVVAGKSAWLFTVGDARSLADLLSRAIENPADVMLAGKEGRKFVLEHFTASQHWLLLKKIYEQALLQ
ncbi:glycosyltransferase [Candidatus Falkowbacteria bacterium]|nr:MAG: glycosyltransferase [Candidatus Falkowbacteria bacterium]